MVWCRPADEDDSYQDDTMDNTDTEDYNQDESDSGDEEVKGPPPKFLNDPQKERKKQGDSVEFSCNVSNVSKYHILSTQQQGLYLKIFFFFMFILIHSIVQSLLSFKIFLPDDNYKINITGFRPKIFISLRELFARLIHS